MRLINQVLVTSPYQDHVTNLKHISTNSVSLATKLGWMVTYLDILLPIQSNDPLITWSSEITWHTKNHYISSAIVPMATKLVRMRDSPWGTPSHVTPTFGHMILHLSRLQWCLSPLNLAEVLLTMMGSHK